jgi:predicted 3-demethylubiquinone-9 3-methyltransferase (glyoxalase superfamily)
MNNNLHPCIWYEGNAGAAALFYCSLFPQSVITNDTPMVVNFELNGQQFMGLNAGPQFKSNPSISFFVTCESDEEINELWSQLSEGGLVMMPLDKYEWSERYGFVQDRFGLSWQLKKGSYAGITQKISPCFLFTGDNYGKAAQAVNLYTEIFSPSSVNGILLYEESEGAHVAGRVKHSQFSLDGNVFMAMDGYGNHAFKFNEAISFVVECRNQEEIDYYWNHLTANGGVESRCGWLKDPFGVSWQIIPMQMGLMMSDPVKAERVMQVVLQMKKLDIATMEKASRF